jgi:2,3-dihydroxybiphenyl 1,2-dioxygenase
MEAVTQLGYLGIGVSNLDAWREFATAVLGMEIADTAGDGSIYLRMDEYHHRFVIHPGGNDDVAYTGWQVKDEAALEEIGERLGEAGVAVEHGSSADNDARRVLGLIKLKDPNGIPTELYYGPLINFETPFTSPRAISGFVTGNQGLGHIVVIPQNVDESLHFYRDLLGMRISDIVEAEVAPGVKLRFPFLHCNPRHHSIALIPAPLPRKLQHFMVQLNSVDDVGSTYCLCEDRGERITAGLGRHLNDQMFSFYLRSPSGFDIEYGWGARTVDDATWQVQKHAGASVRGHKGLIEAISGAAH